MSGNKTHPKTSKNNSTTKNFPFDDRNPSIHYDSEWFLDGTEQEFLGTSHRTNTSGAQATFSFEGEYIHAVLCYIIA